MPFIAVDSAITELKDAAIDLRLKTFGYIEKYSKLVFLPRDIASLWSNVFLASAEIIWRERMFCPQNRSFFSLRDAALHVALFFCDLAVLLSSNGNVEK